MQGCHGEQDRKRAPHDSLLSGLAGRGRLTFKSFQRSSLLPALAEGRRGPQRGISQPQQKLPAVVWGSPGKTASGRDLRLVVSDSGAVRKDVKAYFFTLKLREVIREVP